MNPEDQESINKIRERLLEDIRRDQFRGRCIDYVSWTLIIVLLVTIVTKIIGLW